MQAKTFSVTDFSGGMDTREGVMASDSKSVLESVNYITTSHLKRKTRPPRRLLAGSVGANTQGSRFINGKLCVIAPEGVPVTVTLSVYDVQVLRFDQPDGSSGAWELIDFRVMGSTPVALIKHTFDSAVLPDRYFLHTWDDKRPTYTSDPSCPYSWNGDLPLHAFGGGKLNVPSTRQLRMAVAGNRVWVSMGNGNVKGSAINRPRVWTQRTPADILSNGDWYYYVSNASPLPQSFVIPLPYSDMVADQRYAAYIVEICLPDGSWWQLDEVSNVVNPGTFDIRPYTSPWDGSTITQVLYSYPVDGTVVRFRAISRPPVTIETGNYLNVDGKVLSGVLSHEGRSYATDTIDVSSGVVNGLTYFILDPIPATPIPIPRVVAGSPGSMPINGRTRYWSRILAVLTAQVGPPVFQYNITGTVSITAGSSRVVGIGSLFQTELETGRFIEVSGERRVIKNITSDTTLEVEVAFASTAAAVIALRDYRYRYAYETGVSGNSWYAEREAAATFVLSGTNDAVTLPTAVHDPEGNVPLSITATQNRLLIQYPSTLQLWAVDPDVSNIQQLSVIGQGAGNQTRPDPVLIDGSVALPTSAGVRLFSPQGQGKDYIEFNAIGDRLEGITLPDLDRAVWWHALRCYLTCNSSGGTIYCLSIHREAGVLAWDTWELPGVTSVDSMVTAGDDILIRSGDRIHRMRISDTVYQDDGQPTPIPAHTRWDYWDMARPQSNKRVIRLEIYQKGSSTIKFYMNPQHTGENAPGPRVVGYTIGLQKVPMAVMGPAIALEIDSVDVNGHTLEQIDLDFLLLKR